MLDSNGLLLKRINTYEWISFNFGPTLLDWLERHDPSTYRSIIEADHWSAENFGGHGSAMAQAYNHTILPLSNMRDTRTQVKWGIVDFESRFGRMPEGMWLPEAAVDLETLGVLAEEGILFTVLSPGQAEAVRSKDGTWEDVAAGTVDPRFPYRVELPAGRSLSVFFYNGPLSSDIAFNGLLEDGAMFAKRLIHDLGEPTAGARLSHVATDGESYGHHHRFGEMALAAAVENVRHDPDVQMTNYAQFLHDHPAVGEARVVENSSWSCAHGVERWRSSCGCAPQDHPGWTQEWRAPLRDALDWLRDQAVSDFEGLGGDLFDDPWDARDAYIDVLLGGSPQEFIERHCKAGIDDEARATALDLLEIQLRAMLMYTSCGWFFDDIDRLESVFVLRQAGRLIEVSRSLPGRDFEPEFLLRLEQARSNKGGSARDVYKRQVSPFMNAV